MPIGAVFIGWFLANWRADRKERKDEKNQRIKLLHMLRHELQQVTKFYEEHNDYYSRSSITGHQVIESNVFNTLDHEELMHKLMDYLRKYHTFTETLDSFPVMFAPVQARVLRLSTNEMMRERDKVKLKMLEPVFTAAKPLVKEVEKQIQRINESKQQRRLMRFIEKFSNCILF